MVTPDIITRKVFVVECKLCRRNVPAGVQEFPFKPVAVIYPPCGVRRAYLPSELFLGRVNNLVAKQNRQKGR
jgi:hypothetical protein